MDIPSLHLSNKGEEGEDGKMVYTFARAFWSTWALRLEGAIANGLGKIGVVKPFEGSGKIQSFEKGRFDKGVTEVGGCVRAPPIFYVQSAASFLLPLH